MPAADGNGKGLSPLATMIIGGIALAVVSTFWSVFYGGIQGEIGDIKKAGERLEERYVPRKESTEYRKRVDADLARIDEDVKYLRDTSSPKGELSEKWKSNDAALANLQRQLDDVRKDIGSSYSLGDKLKELQRQIENLQSRQYAPVVNQPPRPSAPAP